MISKQDLQRRLLIAAQAGGPGMVAPVLQEPDLAARMAGPPPDPRLVAPVQKFPDLAARMAPPGPPPPPPSQYQGLLNLAGDAKVPEAIRTSATDAANKHAALAEKAGVDPHEYRSGGEAAEDQGKAERTPAEKRRQPKPQPTLYGELVRRAQAPPAQAPGPEFPIGVPPPPASAPGPSFPLDTGGQAPGPSFPVGVPPPAPPEMLTNKPTFGQALSGGLDVMGSAFGLPPGRPPPPGPPVTLDPGDELPMPNPDGTARWNARPGIKERLGELGAGLRDARTGLFDYMRERDPRGPEFVDKELMTGRGHTSGLGVLPTGEGGIDRAESPNDTRLAAPSFPLTPPGETQRGKEAPGVPVSKPKDIPPGRPGAAATRPKSKQAPGVPVSKPALGTVSAKGESSQWEFPDLRKPAGGIEQTLGPPHQLFPNAGNAAAGGGGSTAPDPNAAPTYSREAEALKPIQPPEPINPLAFALIKGGAAMMAARGPFGQALGEGVGAGLEGYVEARNMDFENLRKANEDQRASRKEARDEYTDTELKRWIAGKEVGLGERGLDVRTLESDRSYNLGERGLGERGREADLEHELGLGQLGLGRTKEEHDYELGQGNLGIAGINARTAQAGLGIRQGELGVAQGQLDVARQAVTPPDAREVMAYTQQLMETYPELKANPQKAYEAAQALFLKMHPASAYGGGLDAILAGQQRPAIPESGITGAVPR